MGYQGLGSLLEKGLLIDTPNIKIGSCSEGLNYMKKLLLLLSLIPNLVYSRNMDLCFFNQR